jgi:hypothetical protein
MYSYFTKNLLNLENFAIKNVIHAASYVKVY